ncbi:Amine oxidase precursor [Parvularcula bermudensis HTCC2503]|uniref:Tryptophan 2-monooxygenase n=1 Tax=Parvularcula bermudensis (strain ATCC BAA-594 / HTCC2503 / KCTC 12087) TaxID=314260 RepID=E0TGD1_PARBH|nr:flavin monoamine oxidase family protein [Parvularcula bermudensis]ADM09174.1 Amine oxidase precursor [Parvularcula bermudensis HTCC2503]
MGTPTRRDLLTMIGATAGSAAMYQAMTALGHAAPSTFSGPVSLEGDPGGASVLVLGAGVAGMTAALELRDAGYNVKILEYREKAGGRCWTLRGGDRYEELGGAVQNVGFAEGNYINPGPWRLPHDHHAVLHYCKRFGVQLEPFIEKNHNAYLHNTEAFGGKPQRYREVASDYRGHISELLAKSLKAGNLNDQVTAEDREVLLESLRNVGALNENYEYRSSLKTSRFRGYDRDPGAGVDGAPLPSTPLDPSQILNSNLWRRFAITEEMEFQTPMFQPVGGMDMIAQAFAREVGDLITYNARVTSLLQEDGQVRVVYEDTAAGNAQRTETADYCVCTIPFSILGQIEHNLSADLSKAIDNMYYLGSAKWGLEFKRRFWEQDEDIYGGISYTNLPIELISYPSTGFFSDGPAVVLGGYSWSPEETYEFNAMSPKERVRWAVEFGSQIHPQYKDEYKSGVSVVWHKVPWVLGCFGIWRDKDTDYQKAIKLDNRVICAGEHLSYRGAWLEGGILSGLNAIQTLHERVIQA